MNEARKFIPRLPPEPARYHPAQDAPDLHRISPEARAKQAANNEAREKAKDQEDLDEISPEDLIPVDADGQEVHTDEEFARDFAEAEKDLAQKDAEAAVDAEEAAQEKAIREAQEGWDTRVEEWEASRNRDVVGEVVADAQADAEVAEKAAATKMAKAFDGLKKVITTTGSVFYELGKYFKEGAEDLMHDTSDAVFGTTVTDAPKKWWSNIFGKQNAEIRQKGVHIDTRTGEMEEFNEQHRSGVVELATMEVTTTKALWDAFAEIPGNIARRFETLSEKSAQERRELAFDIQERALEVRNKTLAAIEAEERTIRSQNLSEQELTAALERLQDRRDVADGDYNDELKKSQEIAPGKVDHVARGIGAALYDGLNYLAMDGLVTEMAQNFTRGVRQERRRKFQEENPNTPYSREMAAMWKPQEQAMGVMERLGDMLGRLAENMRDSREEHQDAVVEEAKNTQRVEAGIYQDAMTARIEALTKKTKISNEDKGEIAYLAVKLARARQGEVGADEMATLVNRAEALAKKAEATKDDENLLLGYITGRAINTIRGLNIMHGKEGESIIRALQEDPSVKNLRRAEALVYAHVERELRPASENLLTPEHKAALQQAHEALKDSVSRATELYKSNLANATAELTKNLQAVNREMKKAAAQAEAAQEERAAA